MGQPNAQSFPPPDTAGEGETVASIIVQDLTPDRIVYADSAKKLASVGNLASWVGGTSNQVVVANDGDGTITLSLPQNIHTAATPQFAGATFTGSLAFSADNTHDLTAVGARPRDVYAGRNLFADGYARVGTSTDAVSAGEFSTGVVSSGRMWFRRRGPGDGYINDNEAAVLNTGRLTIYGAAANDTIDITYYAPGLPNASASFGFQNANGALEFHGERGTSGRSAVFSMQTDSSGYVNCQVRNIADTDGLNLAFDSVLGPAINVEVNAFLDFGAGGALNRYLRLNSSGLFLTSARAFGWTDGAVGGTVDAQLVRDGAAVVAQKNGAIAQAFRVYGATSGSKYLQMEHTGTDGYFLPSVGSLFLGDAGSPRWRIYDSNGSFVAVTDNVYDIGFSGSNRPRSLYAGTSFSGPAGSAAAVTFALGAVNTGVFSPGADYISFSRLGTEIMRHDSAGLVVHASHYIGFGSSGIGSPDVLLSRGGAGLLEQRSGLTPQYYSLYEQYTSGSNYRRLAFGFSTGGFYISAESAVAAAPYLQIMSADELILASSGGSLDVILDTSGHFKPGTDSAQDNGTAAYKWRSIYYSTQILGPDGSVGTPSYSFTSSPDSGIYSQATGMLAVSCNNLGVVGFYDNPLIQMHAGTLLGWSATTVGGSTDLILVRDAAAVLALKNGTTAQALRIYGTTTGPAYTQISHDSANGVITVLVGDLYLSSGKHFNPVTDNSGDLGAGSFRWRTGYFGTSVSVGTNPASAGLVRLANNGAVVSRNSTNAGDASLIYLSTADAVVVSDSSSYGVRIMNHASGTLSFFGVTLASRVAAYTQTYATATRTHAALTSADIGAFTGGSVGFLDAAERDNIRTQFNALKADVTNLKQVVNSLIDDGQTYGLLQ